MKKVIVLLICLLVFMGCATEQEVGESGVFLQPSDIQGTSHFSSYDRQEVENLRGIVTAIRPSKGFYIQSETPDNDPRTSEALFIITRKTNEVAIGDLVSLNGKVQEYYAEGQDAGRLPVTRARLKEIEVLKSGLPLPEAVDFDTLSGSFPQEMIWDDASFSNDLPLDPQVRGLDFYESLEGMLITVKNPTVVGSIHTAYGEFFVVGQWGTSTNARGGLTITEEDGNPEALMIDMIEHPNLTPIDNPPMVVVGDTFNGSITGILTYNYGRYKVMPTEAIPSVTKADLSREVTSLNPETDDLSFASFNVYNLDTNDPREKFDDFAETIVTGLKAPHIITLSEVQDNNGPVDDEVTEADETIGKLINAIEAIGGPPYVYTDVAPESNKDGGEPGGNIRCGFLYRPDFINLVEAERGAFDAAAQITETGINYNPVLIDPADTSFNSSRKPVLGHFRAGGRDVFVIALHLNSKGGDTSGWDKTQPPSFFSEPKRVRQAEVVSNFAASLKESFPEAIVLIGGDLNEYPFRKPVKIIEEAGFVNCAPALLAPEEVYTYIYQQNSQALDHILLDSSTFQAFDIHTDIPHRYSEYLYGERQSDHDPVHILIKGVLNAQ